jgi:hypothetical protein
VAQELVTRHAPTRVVVCLQDDDPKARYVFKNVLSLLGLKYEIRVGDAAWPAPASSLVVTWNGAGRRGDVHVPRSPYKDWRRRPEVTFISDLPILYVGEKPRATFDAGACGFDFVGSIFYLLSRQEEYLQEHRDLWGCFSAYHSLLYEHGILRRPLVNHYAAHLKNELAKAARLKGLEFSAEPAWPDRKRFAVCLTHDVDLIGHNCFRFGARNARRAARGREPYKALRALVGGTRDSLRYSRSQSLCRFDEWLKVEDEFGARSSFYFIPYSENRHEWDSSYKFTDYLPFREGRTTVAGMMRVMTDGGWEVGVHGGYSGFDDYARLSAERESVESVVGRGVSGVRQHYLHLKAPETWRAQSAASFEYDSTLGYNEELGHRAGIASPFTLYDLAADEELPLVELPLTIQDNVLFNYLRLDESEALRRCRSLMDEVASVGGMMTLLWHPNSRGDERLWNVYRGLLGYARSEGAWLSSGEQIARHWRRRASGLAAEGGAMAHVNC